MSRFIRPVSRLARPLAGAALVTLGSAAGASAATPTLKAVERPVQTLGASTVVDRIATGNSQVAWITRPSIAGADPVAAPPAEIWTLRDGVAVQVTRLLDVAPEGVTALEVGTAADGAPVAVVASRRADATSDLRLVRLDTGAVRSVSTTRQGLTIGGVGLDAGRYYYTLHVKTPGSRNTSSLWRATLTGTSVGRATKLRSSRRGETWSGVLADRNRVATATSRRVRSEGRPGLLTEYAFGTPRGTWSRAGAVLMQEGPVQLVDAAGFTQDRSGLVTVQGEESGPGAVATRTPLLGGARRMVRLAGSSFDTRPTPAYDPAQGRFLVVARGDARVLGYTASAFATD